MYTYAMETWAQLRKDGEVPRLLAGHYSEVAADGDDGGCDLDHPQFEWMCQNGMLHVVTVRCDGVLVGYHISLVRRHLHRAVLTAYTDAFYLDPNHRKGMVGYKMFTYATETLKRRGVKWIYSGTKLKKDISKMLEHQGFKHIEETFLKVIK